VIENETVKQLKNKIDKYMKARRFKVLAVPSLM